MPRTLPMPPTSPNTNNIEVSSFFTVKDELVQLLQNKVDGLQSPNHKGLGENIISHAKTFLEEKDDSQLTTKQVEKLITESFRIKFEGKNTLLNIKQLSDYLDGLLALEERINFIKSNIEATKRKLTKKINQISQNRRDQLQTQLTLCIGNLDAQTILRIAIETLSSRESESETIEKIRKLKEKERLRNIKQLSEYLDRLLALEALEKRINFIKSNVESIKRKLSKKITKISQNRRGWLKKQLTLCIKNLDEETILRIAREALTSRESESETIEKIRKLKKKGQLHSINELENIIIKLESCFDEIFSDNNIQGSHYENHIKESREEIIQVAFDDINAVPENTDYRGAVVTAVYRKCDEIDPPPETSPPPRRPKVKIRKDHKSRQSNTSTPTRLLLTQKEVIEIIRAILNKVIERLKNKTFSLGSRQKRLKIENLSTKLDITALPSANQYNTPQSQINYIKNNLKDEQGKSLKTILNKHRFFPIGKTESSKLFKTLTNDKIEEFTRRHTGLKYNNR